MKRILLAIIVAVVGSSPTSAESSRDRTAAEIEARVADNPVKKVVDRWFSEEDGGPNALKAQFLRHAEELGRWSYEFASKGNREPSEIIRKAKEKVAAKRIALVDAFIAAGFSRQDVEQYLSSLEEITEKVEIPSLLDEQKAR